MKSAEEVAEDLFPLIFQDIPNASKIILAQALTDYAEDRARDARVEGYNTGYEKGLEDSVPVYIDADRQKARGEALEEAAKWATDHLTHGNYEWVGEGIRALKDKP